MSEKLIVLDVDGVLADLYLQDQRIEAHQKDWTHEQWASIPLYPWALDLYRRLKQIAPVLIATALNRRYYAAYSGRAEWIHKHLDESRMLMGPPKKDLAMPGRILIDDSRETCESFAKKGAQAIPFPRQWLGEKVVIELVIAEVLRMMSR